MHEIVKFYRATSTKFKAAIENNQLDSDGIYVLTDQQRVFHKDTELQPHEIRLTPIKIHQGRKYVALLIENVIKPLSNYEIHLYLRYRHGGKWGSWWHPVSGDEPVTGKSDYYGYCSIANKQYTPPDGPVYPIQLPGFMTDDKIKTEFNFDNFNYPEFETDRKIALIDFEYDILRPMLKPADPNNATDGLINWQNDVPEARRSYFSSLTYQTYVSCMGMPSTGNHSIQFQFRLYDKTLDKTYVSDHYLVIVPWYRTPRNFLHIGSNSANFENSVIQYGLRISP